MHVISKWQIGSPRNSVPQTLVAKKSSWVVQKFCTYALVGQKCRCHKFQDTTLSQEWLEIS